MNAMTIQHGLPARIAEIGAAATNPNEVNAKKLEDQITYGLLGVWLMIAIITGVANGSILAGAICGGFMLFLFGPAIGLAGQINVSRTHPVPADLDVASVERAIAGLIHASRNGLATVDRPRLQAAVLEAGDVFSALFGMPAWVMVSRTNPMGIPERLAMRGDRLSRDAGPVVTEMAHARKPCGAKMEDLRGAATPVIRMMVAIAHDFGLDTGSLEASDALLPGQDATIERTSSEPAAAARRLADEWISAKVIVDTPTSVMADGAVRELDTAERLWEQARRMAPAVDHLQIDADLKASADTLAITLSDALAERGRIARNDLSTQRNYIEAKHA